MALKTLDNALEVLSYFNHAHQSWGVRELAKEMNMSHSIVYQILSTFEKRGYLKKDEETRKYQLGIKFWEYGLLVQENHTISDLVYPIMKRLSEQTGEFVSLNWLDGLEGICVAMVDSPHSVKFTLSLGTRTSLYPGARSKMILAYLPEDVQLAVLKKELAGEMGDIPTILAELQEIKRAGWCYSIGERTESVFGLSVPLFDAKGKILASLTFAGPEYRMSEHQIPEMLRILQEGQQEIQQQFSKLNPQFIELETKRMSK